MILHHNSLLSLDKTPICHCISQDRALGAGFAALVPRVHVYDIRKRNPAEIGKFHLSYHDGVSIFHLVTKEKASDKPTFDHFCLAVENFVSFANSLGMQSVNCPKMGCGLDKLNWKDVELFLRQQNFLFEVWSIE